MACRAGAFGAVGAVGAVDRGVKVRRFRNMSAMILSVRKMLSRDCTGLDKGCLVETWRPCPDRGRAFPGHVVGSSYLSTGHPTVTMLSVCIKTGTEFAGPIPQLNPVVLNQEVPAQFPLAAAPPKWVLLVVE